jgi:hypothetical protein
MAMARAKEKAIVPFALDVSCIDPPPNLVVLARTILGLGASSWQDGG